MQKTEIFCTLGPSSLTPKFLKFTNRRVSLLRLNMSHLSIKLMQRNINFIKKYSSIPICIDTEGAQIRSKVRVKKKIKTNTRILMKRFGWNLSLYPENIFDLLRVRDKLEIGFEGLKTKILRKKKESNYFNLYQWRNFKKQPRSAFSKSKY